MAYDKILESPTPVSRYDGIPSQILMKMLFWCLRESYLLLILGFKTVIRSQRPVYSNIKIRLIGLRTILSKERNLPNFAADRLPNSGGMLIAPAKLFDTRVTGYRQS